MESYINCLKKYMVEEYDKNGDVVCAYYLIPEDIKPKLFAAIELEEALKNHPLPKDEPKVAPWMREIWRNARKNAKTRGIEFNLSESDLFILYERCDGKCEVSGLPFEFNRVGFHKRNPFKPSLDRVDSQKPYTLRNVRVVSIIANMAMNEWGYDPLVKFVKAVNEKITQT